MASYRSLRDFDWPMFILSMAICSMGVLQIFSATHDTRWSGAWWRQVVYILCAIVVMWVATLIDYHTLLGQVPLFYGLSTLTLIATFIVGTKVFGCRRWIGYGGLQATDFGIR